MRESLVVLLEALGYAVQAFSLASSFYRFYRPTMPGCLLLDVRMPGQDGLDLYAQLLREGKRLPAVFMTAHANVSTAVEAMKTGAIEFLEKPFERSTLQAAIEKALALDAQWRRREADFAVLEARIQRLSERERETLDLILAGTANKAMAEQLYLSERAVEMRRASLMRKLQVKSVAELFDLALSHRILSDLRRAADQQLR